MTTRPRGGDRYVVTEPFEAGVLTHFSAPFTGGGTKQLPVGLEFIVSADPPQTATAVLARADPYMQWEQALVSAEDRNDEKYGGYSISVPFDLLASHCARR